MATTDDIQSEQLFQEGIVTVQKNVMNASFKTYGKVSRRHLHLLGKRPSGQNIIGPPFSYHTVSLLINDSEDPFCIPGTLCKHHLADHVGVFRCTTLES